MSVINRLLLIVLSNLACLQVYSDDNIFDYSVMPDLSSGDSISVRNFTGSLSISPYGSASYHIPLELATGLPDMMPQIGLTLNSHFGNGIVGMGGSISGLSLITRVPHDIFHDGTAKGISYDYDDAFALDGQRMIQITQYQGTDSATYCLENDPHTHICAHKMTSGNCGMWFTVKTEDGVIREYGKDGSTQSLGGYTNVWYVNKVTNPIGNYATYSYTTIDGQTYPSEIVYGKNYFAANEFEAKVQFDYENRPDTILFRIKGYAGQITKRLSRITTSANSQIFRIYNLKYPIVTTDNVYQSRLISITPENANRQTLRPISFIWEATHDLRIEDSLFTVPFRPITQGQTITNDCIVFSGDFNGDGINDFAKQATAWESIGGNTMHYYTALDFTLSKRNNGIINYTIGQSFNLPADLINNWYRNKSHNRAPMITDIDGDGMSDFIAMYDRTNIDGTILLGYIKGRELRDGYIANVHTENYTMQGPATSPLYVADDFNNDGIADILVMESSPLWIDNAYHGIIFQGDSLSPISRLVSFTLPDTPKHIFTADFDDDGMKDIMIIHDAGYIIFWNRGNGISSNTFTVGNSASNFAGVYKIYPGDFNGDGLTDFLTTTKDNGDWFFELSNGDGTFCHQLACTIEAYEQSATDDDDNALTCIVYDANNDGKTDVFVCKNTYFNNSNQYVYDKTISYWLISTGHNLVQVFKYYSTNENNGLSQYLCCGDFDGNGILEISNLGYSLLDTYGLNTAEGMHKYTNPIGGCAGTFFTEITNSNGCLTKITYDFLGTPETYNSVETSYPIVSIAPKYRVVKRVYTDEGSIGKNVVNYTYGGFRLHMEGLGILGFDTITTSKPKFHSVAKTITQWNHSLQKPVSLNKTELIDTYLKNEITQYTYFQPYADKTVTFVSNLSIRSTDFEGIVTSQVYSYNTSTGALEIIEETKSGNLKKREQRFNYTTVAGQFLPQRIVLTKTYGDETPHIEETHFTYSSHGQIISKTKNYGTPQQQTTLFTYDSFGNCLSESLNAGNLPAITDAHEFDTTHRFKTKTTKRGLYIITYEYDLWGNCLNIIDRTRSNHLITSFSYDGWGQITSKTEPTGNVTSYIRGWGNQENPNIYECYYITILGKGIPWEKKWYDAEGRETKTYSIGFDNMPIKTVINYDSLGRVTSKYIEHGEHIWPKIWEYDIIGRVVRETSQGYTKTYSYEGLNITEHQPQTDVIKSYDGWGNIVTLSDTSGMVTYKYNSQGYPIEVKVHDIKTKMEYDAAGNRTKLTDPTTGTSTYTYDALSRIVKQTDSRGTKSYDYDCYGRLITFRRDSLDITQYTYGTASTQKGFLLSVDRNSNKIVYGYDSYGRVKTQQRLIAGNSSYTKIYTYNNIGQIIKTSYQYGMLNINHEYDCYGNLVCEKRNNTPFFSLHYQDVLNNVEQWGPQMALETVYRDYGITDQINFYKNVNTSDAPLSMTFDYDNSMNIVARSGMFESQETFEYDELDRLTTNTKNGTTYTTHYDAKGNITYKDGIGNYHYKDTKPFEVSGVDNVLGLISWQDMKIEYNSDGKVCSINNGTANLQIIYGPDGERWKTVLTKNGATRTTLYLEGYEIVIDSLGQRYFYYLSGNTLITKQGTTIDTYHLIKDNIGSIVAIVNDSDGTERFRATYDEWGRQTITLNDLPFTFHRGYTGHEMLPDFQLINMNGRLYDPLIARFISPDDYIQDTQNTQNFNRYSYCLNNPLKYTDPSGEFFLGMIASATFNAIQNINKHGFNVSQYNWTLTKNAWLIDRTPFTGNLLNIISNLTWGSVNTYIGNTIAHFTNICNIADGFTNLGGMTAIGNINSKERAFTIGPYSFGPKGYKATWKDHLFVHEYGHYVQHLYWGSLYLPIIGASSLKSAVYSDSHKYKWYEVDASKKGGSYFDKHYGHKSMAYYNAINNGTYSPKDFFDFYSFSESLASGYINPRNHSFNYESHPIKGSQSNIWDIIISLLLW